MWNQDAREGLLRDVNRVSRSMQPDRDTIPTTTDETIATSYASSAAYEVVCSPTERSRSASAPRQYSLDELQQTMFAYRTPVVHGKPMAVWMLYLLLMPLVSLGLYVVGCTTAAKLDQLACPIFSVLFGEEGVSSTANSSTAVLR